MRYSGSMEIIITIILFVLLIWTLIMRWPHDQLSIPELERRAKHNKKYHARLQLRKLYPAYRTWRTLKGLIIGLVLTTLLVKWHGWFGTLESFGLIIAAFAIAGLIPNKWIDVLSQKIFANNADFYIRVMSYFSWMGREQPPAPEMISSRAELRELVRNSVDTLSSDEQKLIIGALDFGDRKIDDFMTPLNDITFVKSRETLGPMLLDELHKTGHRVFPVVKTNLNSIVGTLNLDDVLPLKQESQTVSQVMRKPLPLIETGETCENALAHFMEYHCSQFVVVDAEQNTIGLIGLSDVIEALFGRNVIE